MKMTIFKYRRPYSQIGNDNYFFWLSFQPEGRVLSYVDHIVLERQLKNSFPIFKEEWIQEDDINVLKTGYFDVKLALSMSEVSVFGKTIERFFESNKSSISDFKYVIVCETGHSERSYSGVIDNSSVSTDLTVNDAQYYLTFTITGMEKEAVELMKQSRISAILYDMNFETQYLNNIFYYLLSPKLILDNRLNIAGKIGSPLIIDKNIQNAMYFGNFNNVFQVCNINVWDAVKSFIIGYGFRFRIVFSHVADKFPVYKLILFYRSDALNTVSIPKFKKYTKSLSVAGSKFIALLYTQYTDALNSDIEHYTGILMNRENIAIGNIDQNKPLRYYVASNGLTANEDDVTVLNLTRYNAGSSIFEDFVAYCRCVPGQTINPLLHYIANNELKHYLYTWREGRKLTIKVPDDSNLVLSSKAVIDGSNYICERINSFDNFNQTMETEWIQT